MAKKLNELEKEYLKALKKARTEWLTLRFCVCLNDWKFIQKVQKLPCTDKAFAETIGVARSAIVKYKRGDAVPSDKTLLKICALLQLHPEFFSPVAALNHIKSDVGLFLAKDQQAEKGYRVEDFQEVDTDAEEVDIAE